MSILNGQPQIATKEHVNAPWSGSKKNFRCGFCGHKFKVGDYWRFVFTNDIPSAGGNPLICEKCDDDNEVVREKWVQKHKKFKELDNDFWWFLKRRINNE